MAFLPASGSGFIKTIQSGRLDCHLEVVYAKVTHRTYLTAPSPWSRAGGSFILGVVGGEMTRELISWVLLSTVRASSFVSEALLLPVKVSGCLWNGITERVPPSWGPVSSGKGLPGGSLATTLKEKGSRYWARI